MENLTKKMINLVYQDVKPAIGCTDPVAVAFAGSVCKRYVTGDIKKVVLTTSKNIYKNGKSVIVPNTNGRAGLKLAFALGLLYGDYEKNLLVLSDITDNQLNNTLKFLENSDISEEIEYNSHNIYIKGDIFTTEETIQVIISAAHTNIVFIKVNDTILFEKNVCDTSSPEDEIIKTLDFDKLIQMANIADINDLQYMKEGIALNTKVSNESLEGDYGLNVGKTLKYLQEKNIIGNDIITNIKIATSAAADMRMGGGSLPVMTSGGSGNQGIGVILPIYLVAQKENIEEEKMLRAIFLGHIVNKYAKVYSGKLSGMCGCAIGAGVGVCAAITYMLDGTNEQIKGSSNNLLANLTGMICDGAKDNCSLKLSSCVSEATMCAYLALNNIIVRNNVGIVSDTIENTIKNVGILCNKGFVKSDEVLLDLIK